MSSVWDDILPLDGTGQDHVTHFFKFWAPVISLESVKLGTWCHMCWLILMSTVACMIDYRGMCSGSSNAFRFWGISDNISKTVEDRDRMQWKTNRKSYVAYQMIPLPWRTLKVTFAVWNVSVSHTSGNAVCIAYSVFARELESTDDF